MSIKSIVGRRNALGPPLGLALGGQVAALLPALVRLRVQQFSSVLASIRPILLAVSVSTVLVVLGYAREPSSRLVFCAMLLNYSLSSAMDEDDPDEEEEEEEKEEEEALFEEEEAEFGVGREGRL